MNRFLSILNMVLPVFLGGLIYISYRSVDLSMFLWFTKLGLVEQVWEMRSFVEFNKWISNPSRFTLYCLPDGLWTYSMTSSFTYVWRENYKEGAPWILFGVSIGVLSEFAQMFNLVSGVFDIGDIFAYVSFFMIAFFVQSNFNKKL
jgi:hypothetical protein